MVTILFASDAPSNQSLRDMQNTEHSIKVPGELPLDWLCEANCLKECMLFGASWRRRVECAMSLPAMVADARIASQ